MAASPDNFIFETVAIIGVGLIGGSIGMAIKKDGLAKNVIGIGRNEQKLMQAKILGAIDYYSLDMKTGAADADLIIICTPVRKIVNTLRQLSKSLKPGAVLTDVGSTKHEIVRNAMDVLPDNVSFIGGHPMAGSEKAGVEAAFPDLFLGATYILTPTDATDITAVGKMTTLAESIGARVEIMTPEKHDAAVAVVSHLPHAMAAALLHQAEAAQMNSDKVFRIAAGSFRDLTRISDSPPEIWRDIFLTNADSICDAIDDFQKHLSELKDALLECDEEILLKYFENAQNIRQTFKRISK